MVKKPNTIAEILGKATIASTAALSGCSVDVPTQSDIDVVNAVNSNSVASTNVHLQWPDQLKSNPQGKVIDLTDPKQVAEAMGVELDGTPDQVLYTITAGVTDITSNLMHLNKRTKFPITVANVADGAAIINNAEDHLILKHVDKIQKAETNTPTEKSR